MPAGQFRDQEFQDWEFRRLLDFSGSLRKIAESQRGLIPSRDSSMVDDSGGEPPSTTAE